MSRLKFKASSGSRPLSHRGEEKPREKYYAKEYRERPGCNSLSAAHHGHYARINAALII